MRRRSGALTADIVFAEKQNDVLFLVRFDCSHCVVCSLSFSCLSICLKAISAAAPYRAGKYASRQHSAKSGRYVMLFAWSGCLLPFGLFLSLSLCYSCSFAGGCACVFPASFRIRKYSIQERRDTDRAFKASTAES